MLTNATFNDWVLIKYEQLYNVCKKITYIRKTHEKKTFLQYILYISIKFHLIFDFMYYNFTLYSLQTHLSCLDLMGGEKNLKYLFENKKHVFWLSDGICLYGW